MLQAAPARPGVSPVSVIETEEEMAERRLRSLLRGDSGIVAILTRDYRMTKDELFHIRPTAQRNMPEAVRELLSMKKK